MMEALLLHGRYQMLQLMAAGLILNYYGRRLSGLSTDRVEERMIETHVEAKRIWRHMHKKYER